MSELENAWIHRRTDQLLAEGLAWSAAKMIALNELHKRHQQRCAVPAVAAAQAKSGQPTLYTV